MNVPTSLISSLKSTKYQGEYVPFHCRETRQSRHEDDCAVIELVIDFCSKNKSVSHWHTLGDRAMPP
jgi:hypothetical protein